jgi:hypothetical protein
MYPLRRANKIMVEASGEDNCLNFVPCANIFKKWSGQEALI